MYFFTVYTTDDLFIYYLLEPATFKDKGTLYTFFRTVTENIEFSFIVSGSERTYIFHIPLYWWLMIFLWIRNLK